MRRHLSAIEDMSVVIGTSTDEEGEKLPVSEWRYSTPYRLFERLGALRGDKNDYLVGI